MLCVLVFQTDVGHRRVGIVRTRFLLGRYGNVIPDLEMTSLEVSPEFEL